MSNVPFWGPDFAQLEAEDPEIAGILLGELDRLRSGIQLIASENFTSPAVLAALGSTLSNKYADIITCLVFGLLGYFFQKYGFPVIAVVLGMILGPIGERGFHQSLLMSKGSYLVFFTRPISLILFLLTVLVLFSQILKPHWESYKERKYKERLK